MLGLDQVPGILTLYTGPVPALFSTTDNSKIAVPIAQMGK